MPSPSYKKARITPIRTVDLYWLKCNDCGQSWTPMTKRGGYRYRGWWRCPNGCNDDVRTT